MNTPSPSTVLPHPIPKRVFLQQTAMALMTLPMVSATGIAAEGDKFAPADFLSVQQGDLPIILSAPHGGVLPIPGVPERTGEGMKKGATGFSTGRDGNTELLAAAIAHAIEARLGRKPYFVIARFHRKYIDPNRPPEIAVEHPRAREVYDLYRGTLAKFCDAVQARFRHGLLIDIHGQGSARDTVFRGTHNGATCAMLVKAFGEKVHAGPQSLTGLVNARGIKMKPSDTGAEAGGFTGGHIVQTYGRHEGIGAVQFEFGWDFREKDTIPAAAEKVAAGITDFAKLYLLEKADAKK